MSKKRKLVEFQKLKVERGSTGSYDAWNKLHSTRTKDGETIDGPPEHTQANPDELPELNNTSPSTPQLIMGEAVQHLQGRQKEIYLLSMREDKSLAEIAEILSISKGTAQTYKNRAIKFIQGYCQEAIKKGRV